MLQSADLSADLRLYTARRCAGTSKRPRYCVICKPKIAPSEICRQHQHPQSVLPVKFARNCAGTKVRNLTYEGSSAGCAAHRDIADVSEGGHLRLWDLHLYLIADSGSRIAPIAWRYEAAGPGCSNDSRSNRICGRTELTCHGAIYTDIDRRVVLRLLIFKVSQLGNSSEPLTHTFRITCHIRILRTGHRDFGQGGRTEVENLADEIARVEGEVWHQETVAAASFATGLRDLPA